MMGQGVCGQSFTATYRVQVFTFEGVQIGLPGVGEGVNRLTFPAGYVIKDAMDAPIWIRFATEKESRRRRLLGLTRVGGERLISNRGPFVIAMGCLHLRTSLLVYVETP